MARRLQKWASLCARSGIGLVFLAAAVPKLADPGSFKDTLGNYHLLPEATLLPLAYFVPTVEAFVGLCLMAGFYTVGAARLAALLAVGFVLAVVSALVRGLNVECGCFGGAATVSWAHVAIDLVILITAIYLAKQGPTAYSLDRLRSEASPIAKPKQQLIAVLVCSVVLAAANVAISTSAPRNEPVLEQSSQALKFEPPLLQLGIVPQETETEGQVAYKNHSNGTIKIEKIVTSCGCTAPELTAHVLEPGQVGQMKIKFRPGDNRGESTQTVKLYLTGHVEPAELKVVATIDAPISVEPGVVILQEVGDSAVVNLKANRPDTKFRVTGVSSPSHSLQIQTSSPDSSGQVQLKVSVKSPLNKEKLEPIFPITISTDLGTSCLLYIKHD